MKKNAKSTSLINNNINQDANQKKPKKKCTCYGRDAKVDADLYYKIKEENDQLKKALSAKEDEIRKMKVICANIKDGIIKERKEAEYKVIVKNKDSNPELEKTKLENQKLRNENQKKNLIIQGLQSNALMLKTKQKSTNRKKCKSKDPLTYQSEKNDQLALISRLREQLKKTNEEKHLLLDELRSKRLSTMKNYNPGFFDEKNLRSKIDNLNSEYQDANMKLDAKNKLVDTMNISLQNYVEKYEKEKEK